MGRYIKCCYCYEVLEEVDDDVEIPTSAYHRDCYEREMLANHQDDNRRGELE